MPTLLKPFTKTEPSPIGQNQILGFLILTNSTEHTRIPSYIYDYQPKSTLERKKIEKLRGGNSGAYRTAARERHQVADEESSTGDEAPSHSSRRPAATPTTGVKPSSRTAASASPPLSRTTSTSPPPLSSPTSLFGKKLADKT